jgi:hypothetical protein
LAFVWVHVAWSSLCRIGLYLLMMAKTLVGGCVKTRDRPFNMRMRMNFRSKSAAAGVLLDCMDKMTHTRKMECATASAHGWLSIVGLSVIQPEI